MSDRRNVQDVYPLSPLQEGMLFESLYAPESGVYVEQIAAELRGDLDAAAFAAAWRRAVDRHPVLRTAFVWKRVERPLQVVHREVELPVVEEDWRGLGDAERERRLEAYLAADAARGFDLARPPLMRLALFRTGEERHRVVWSFHHVLLDGWSVPLVLQRVLAIYRALRAGGGGTVDPGRPFRDYVRWLAGRDRAEAEAFWRRYLAGVPEPVRLAGAGERPAAAGRGEIARPLGGLLTPGRAAALRARRLTVSTLVHGAWALLLHHLGAGDDLVFGSTVSGRPPDLDGAGEMVGLFINTLPVRVRIDPAAAAADWLAALQEEQLEQRRFEHAPLVDVQEWSGGRRGRPLFETLVVFESQPVDETLGAAGGGVEIGGLRVVERTSHVLDLVASPRPALSLRLHYRRDRFRRAEAERLLDRLERLLAGLLDALDGRLGAALGEISPLPAAEVEELIFGRNRTARPLPAEPTVAARFGSWAAAAPDAVALEAGERCWSYGALDRAASGLAGRLAGAGVTPGDRVGLLLPRGAGLIAAMLAAAKAGACYVPLDPSYPPERLGWMAADAGLRAVVTAAGGAMEAGIEWPAGAARVTVDPELASRPAGPERPAGWCVAVPASMPLYVIYTSGSTGRPKGVVVDQPAVLRLVTDPGYVTLGPGDRIAQASSSSFDAATFEVWGALLNGATLAVVEREELLAPRRLAERLRRSRITTLFLTTAMFNEAVRQEPAVFAPLRELLFGGEAVDPGAVRRCLAEGAPARLLHVYGPTEVTTFATWHPVEAVSEGARTVPIGRPIGNTRAYVVDRRGRPAPDGVAGELWLGGPGTAHGYLGRPGLTAARFVPDPFSGEPGGRLYRTGDRVRWGAGEALEFLGRFDRQVKIRGFRIEPGEVEAALAAEPAVAEAVVTVREDPERRLVAYVVPAAAVTVEALRAALASRLPGHMMPAAWVLLERLPLTPNGKIDRAALPAPEAAGALGAEAEAWTAPRGPLEEMAAGVFAEVLGAERVGAHDDFFDLGGHSLKATQAASRLSRLVGAEVPLRDLFEAPTPAGLAARLAPRLSAQAAGGADGGPPPLVPVPRDRPLPLSFAQQRLWFLDRLEGAAGGYVVVSAVRLAGELDGAALAHALDGLAARHEALRTRFPDDRGEPRQEVAPPAPVPLPAAALAALPAARRPEEARRAVRRLAGRRFDLAAGPLFRAAVLSLGPDDRLLVLTLHHAVADGWSMNVLVRDLAELYRAASARRPPALPALPVQPADHAAWQREWLAGGALAAGLDWWRSRLAGAPRLDLPTDRPRPAAQSFRGGAVEWRLEPAPAAALRAFCRREGATPFMALVTAFQAVLGRWSGQDDVTIGTPVAGRTRPELEGLVGLFINTLALRTALPRTLTCREALARVRETALGAYAHQEVPFERLVDALRLERDLGRNPLFQVMVILQNSPGMGADLGGLRLEPVQVSGRSARFDLTLEAVERGGGFDLALEYASDLFDRTTARRLVSQVGTVLGSLAASAPEELMGSLAWRPAAERHQVVAEWGWGGPLRGAGAEEFGPRAASAFERRAAETPDAVAVCAGGAALSYGELLARSARIARGLRRLGVSAEARVALAAERTPGLVVGLLGVLRGGGCYVPLDPGYPRERLAWMIEDSRCAAVLRVGVAAAALPAALAGVPSVTLEEVLALGGESGAAGGSSLAGTSPDAEPAGASGSELAYVIYTSGSTGRPKGVAVPHGAVASFLESMAEAPGLGRGDRLVAVTTLSFDIAVLELLLPLSVGATVELASRAEASDPAALAALLERSGATAMQATPSAWRGLVEWGWPGRSGLKALCGGEALPRELAEELAARTGELWNLYGPTETTVWSARARVAAGEVAGRPVPIGRPIAATGCYVLDRGMAPQPPGVPGALYLGGAGVVRGYLGRPGLTANRFLPDPFAEGPGARMYATGDRARWRADGQLEFLGRLDQQVKVRGHRIEPGEIEAALTAHSGVEAAAVVAVPLAAGAADESLRLVAFAVAPGVAARELRAWLAARLPAPMVPSLVVPIDALPLTPNGKTDRRELARIAREQGAGQARAALGGEHVEPATPAERALAAVWAGLLGLERVGARDNFFEIGGDSILAVRVVARAREAGVELSLGQLFRFQTVAELARAAAPGEAAAPEEAIPRRGGGEAPLSFAQERMWFLAQLDPAATYNLPLAVELEGPLDAAAFRRTLAEVARRHQVLRTRYPSRRGEPVQAVDSAGGPTGFGPALPRFDLGALPAGRRDGELSRLARREGALPFDLARGPVWRPALVRLGAWRHVVLATFHHVAADAWSLGVLLREVAAIYGALAAGRQPGLPEPPIQYADWAAWQRRRFAAGALAEQLGYWRRRLAGRPSELRLGRPAGTAGAAGRSGRGSRLRGELAPALAAGVEALARSARATPFMALFAAFQACLHRRTGARDLVTGTAVSGRGRPETEGLIGCFVNMLPLRTDLSGRPSFRELLDRVRRDLVEDFARQELPFERLVEELGADGGDGPPLFRVTFGLQNLPPAAAAGAGLAARPWERPLETARYDLAVWLWRRGDGGLEGTWTFDPGLLDETEAAAIRDDFADLVAAAVARPDDEIDALEPPRPRGDGRPRRRPLLNVQPRPVRIAGAAAQPTRTTD